MTISIEDITKSFGSQVVLNHIDLTVNKGQTYCILGRNGAGKTTLINILLDLIKADSGKMSFDNQTYRTSAMEIKKRLGVMIDETLIEELDGFSYLMLTGKLYNLPKNILTERIKSIIDYFFDSEKDLRKKISQYSTGMKKKLAVCSAVIHTPEILILDEPFSGLDPIGAKLLVDFLVKYQNGERIIFLSSHDLSYVQKVSTHIGVLEDGNILFNGTIESFTEDGKHQLDESLLQILGSSESPIAELKWI